MIRCPRPPWLSAVTLALALASASSARAGITVLPDSTVHDVWRLANGLKVVAHHISTAHHVAITLAWPTGSDADPVGRVGQAELLAELEYFGAAGSVPERTRAEMNTIRPAGWNVSAGSRVTQLTEVALLPQFPGALHQVAERLRGVTLTEAGVKTCLDDVRGDLDAMRHPTSNAELYSGVRQVALGRYAPGAADEGLRTLARVPTAELQALMRKTFVPSGAVLSLAGNLGDMNLHALVENEFGAIPAGDPLPPLLHPHYTAGVKRAARPGLTGDAGALAIIAPALDDSTHPSFYFAMLMFASFATQAWGQPQAPLTSRFQYSLFDDPDLARFYPPAGPGERGDTVLDLAFDMAVGRLGSMVIPPESEEPIFRGVLWLLGDAMPPEVLGRAARDPSVLAAVAYNQAARELWGGEPFWSDYRGRFIHYTRAYNMWIDYLLAPGHRVKLLLTPGAGGAR